MSPPPRRRYMMRMRDKAANRLAALCNADSNGSIDIDERDSNSHPTWYWPPKSQRPEHVYAEAYATKQCCDLKPPPKLRRNLTQQSERKSNPGSGSRLLQLPPELRANIWHYAVGGQRIALFRDNGRLVHCVLDRTNSRTVEELVSITPESVPIEVSLICGELSPEDLRDGTPLPRKSSPLALSMTCHLIYYETIELLYSENTFILLQNRTLPDFHATILPHRFAAIRSLHIHWQLRHVPERGRDHPRPWTYRDLAESLTPLRDAGPIKHLSLFLQGPLLGILCYKRVLYTLRYCRGGKTTRSFTARLPRVLLVGADWERIEIREEIENSQLSIVQPPGQDNNEIADRDTGFDVGWRVGTMFFPPDNGSSEIEMTTYAVFTPLPI